jgi:cyclic pyranopterin phosphate synthase
MINLERPHLLDSFQRKVNYLRISITDKCNLRCRYCAPARAKALREPQLLSLQEIYRLVRIAVDLGITKVRLTGGEPLCRKGVGGLIGAISALPQIDDISVTTNATLLLAHRAEALKNAGLNRINISLDTLDREKYLRLTGADRFDDVWSGLMTALQTGFAPIKINMVVMRGVNDDEIEAMARLAETYPFHVRFIEYMPIGTDPLQARGYFVPVAEIEARLRQMGRLLPVASADDGGPARRFRFVDAPGEVGWIGSMSTHFCRSCNRIRLTADGHLRACLLAEDQVNVVTPLRSGASDETIAACFRQAIRGKRRQHQMDFSRDRMLQTQMVSIGG